MDAVHESGIIAHLRWQRAEKMTNPLLVLHIHLEVANHNNTAIGADTLLSAAKLAGFHISLHDIHTVLLVEGHARDFVKADYVILADQSALTVGIIDEHACYRRFAS